MKIDWQICKAQSHHSAELAQLVNSAYRGESSRSGWTTEADFLDGQRTDPSSLQESAILNPNKSGFV